MRLSSAKLKKSAEVFDVRSVHFLHGHGNLGSVRILDTYVRDQRAMPHTYIYHNVRSRPFSAGDLHLGRMQDSERPAADADSQQVLRNQGRGKPIEKCQESLV